MKIGYFVSKFPYPDSYPNYICGGSIFATQSLVHEISKFGYNIKIFTSSRNSKNEFKNHRNIDIYRYGTNIKIFSSNLSIGLFNESMKQDVDIVHTIFDIPPGPLAGLRYAKKKGLPLIVTYHGDWDDSYGNFIRKVGVSITNKLIINDLLSYADVIISPSKLYANNSRYLHDFLDKIHVIPNGIDLREFQIDYTKMESREKLNLPLENKIILFFGYLSPYKSPDILLKAFKEILKTEKDAMLLFAGSGEMEGQLKSLSRKLGIQKNVLFAGFIKKEDRPLYYKSSDIFCLPSSLSTECYPLAILEAMASKIPVVSSNIGGIPDLIEDGVNGVLVPPLNEKELIYEILKLLDNSNIIKKLSKNAFNGIKRYSWENIAKETNKIYKTVGGYQ